MTLIYDFMRITEKKMQHYENGCKYILFRIDVYFTEYLLAVEIYKKGHTNRDAIFEEKRSKALEKLGCKLLAINTSKESYDTHCEASRIATFISQLEDR